MQAFAQCAISRKLPGHPNCAAGVVLIPSGKLSWLNFFQRQNQRTVIGIFLISIKTFEPTKADIENLFQPRAAGLGIEFGIFYVDGLCVSGRIHNQQQRRCGQESDNF